MLWPPLGVRFLVGHCTCDSYSGLLSTAGAFIPTREASFSEYTTSKYDRDISSRKGHWMGLAGPLMDSVVGGAAPPIQQTPPQVPKSPPTSFVFVNGKIYYRFQIGVPAPGLLRDSEKSEPIAHPPFHVQASKSI
jgi:hypothetical protein